MHIAADDGGLLDGDDDAGHPLDPGHILDDSGLLDLAGQLEHGVEGAAAGEGDVLDCAYDDEQSIGIEEVDVLIGKQDEEGRLRIIIEEQVAASLQNSNSKISKARKATRNAPGFK